MNIIEALKALAEGKTITDRGKFIRIAEIGNQYMILEKYQTLGTETNDALVLYCDVKYEVV